MSYMQAPNGEWFYKTGSDLLETLRSNNFDANSSFGAMIDNSIQANAAQVKVKFDCHETAKTTEWLRGIGFSDDGDGMGMDADGEDILFNCLALGWSSRYNDRTGIGRFGVGMTLGAISMCRRVEVYTKTKESGWRYTYLDLDEIAEGLVEGISTPVARKPGEPWLDILPEESGTLVVWLKHDRQQVAAGELSEDFKKWAGRTYRRFIWDGLYIEIDEETVKAIDPLYVNPAKTRYPNDPPAEEIPPIKLEWYVPGNPGAPLKSVITIRQSILPEFLRERMGVGSTGEAKKRFVEENEGISILRNGREVFYGHIPYFRNRFIDIDRFWGCEVSFDAVLDNEFNVQNTKFGVPSANLKVAIAQKVNPTRMHVRERVRELWRWNRKLDNLGTGDLLR